MSAAGLGSVFAYTATAIPDMRVQNSFGEITSGQEAWIGSFGLVKRIYTFLTLSKSLIHFLCFS